jgi:hypothetical protein
MTKYFCSITNMSKCSPDPTFPSSLPLKHIRRESPPPYELQDMAQMLSDSQIRALHGELLGELQLLGQLQLLELGASDRNSALMIVHRVVAGHCERDFSAIWLLWLT